MAGYTGTKRGSVAGLPKEGGREARLQSAMEYLNLLGKGSSKLQSAMEYLMTYGWAILIIAVVLGVLYYLGIFNGQNLAPRLQPGSCHVARTSAGVENFGVCAGLPEFVASLGGSGSSGILMNSPISIDQATQGYTVSAWIYTTRTDNADAQAIFKGLSNNYAVFGLSLNGGGWVGICGWENGICASSPNGCYANANVTSTNAWYNIVGVWTPGNVVAIYVNGKFVFNCASGGGNVNIDSTPEIGSISDINGYNTVFQGYISNVQLYNASLSTAEVQALYMEGIGGAPIKPANVTGWWPLNGDANDYSGNNNNGQSTDVQYTNTWISSYGAP